MAPDVANSRRHHHVGVVVGHAVIGLTDHVEVGWGHRMILPVPLGQPRPERHAAADRPQRDLPGRLRPPHRPLPPSAPPRPLPRVAGLLQRPGQHRHERDRLDPLRVAGAPRPGSPSPRPTEDHGTGTSLVAGELVARACLSLTVESEHLVAFGNGMVAFGNGMEDYTPDLTCGQTVRVGVCADRLQLV